MRATVIFLKSSIGRKFVMALTGFVLVGFVIAHMLGNLQIFMGPDVLNGYADMLKSRPWLLWGIRIFLLICAVLHVMTAFSLIRENHKARPVGYERQTNQQASVASLTMAISGMLVLVFIVYHILHFTVMAFNPGFKDLMVRLPHHGNELYPDVYRRVIQGFSNRMVSGFYIISVGLLCVHLSHGISSMFQSIGLKTRGTICPFNCLARIVSILLFLGMAAVPLAVLFGWVR